VLFRSYDKAKAAYESYEKIRDTAVDAAQGGANASSVLAIINAAMEQYLALVATFGVK